MRNLDLNEYSQAIFEKVKVLRRKFHCLWMTGLTLSKYSIGISAHTGSCSSRRLNSYPWLTTFLQNTQAFCGFLKNNKKTTGTPVRSVLWLVQALLIQVVWYGGAGWFRKGRKFSLLVERKTRNTELLGIQKFKLQNLEGRRKFSDFARIQTSWTPKDVGWWWG